MIRRWLAVAGLVPLLSLGLGTASGPVSHDVTVQAGPRCSSVFDWQTYPNGQPYAYMTVDWETNQCGLLIAPAIGCKFIFAYSGHYRYGGIVEGTEVIDKVACNFDDPYLVNGWYDLSYNEGATWQPWVRLFGGDCCGQPHP